MSVAYFLSTNIKLNKTEYSYKNIFENHQNILFDDEGIIFDDKLWDSEEVTLGNIFRQRYIYAIRSTIELSFGENQKQISEQYYNTAKNQVVWLKEFIKKLLQKSYDVFLIRLTLGNKTEFGKIVTQIIDINDFSVSNKTFEFKPLVIYQFVDNSEQHIEWMKKNINKKIY